MKTVRLCVGLYAYNIPDLSRIIPGLIQLNNLTALELSSNQISDVSFFDIVQVFFFITLIWYNETGQFVQSDSEEAQT